MDISHSLVEFCRGACLFQFLPYIRPEEAGVTSTLNIVARVGLCIHNVLFASLTPLLNKEAGSSCRPPQADNARGSGEVVLSLFLPHPASPYKGEEIFSPLLTKEGKGEVFFFVFLSHHFQLHCVSRGNWSLAPYKWEEKDAHHSGLLIHPPALLIGGRTVREDNKG